MVTKGAGQAVKGAAKNSALSSIRWLNKTFPVTNRNNFVRINTDRLAFGPNKSFYQGRGKGSGIPYHFEINWKDRTAFLERNVKKNKSVEVWRRRW